MDLLRLDLSEKSHPTKTSPSWIRSFTCLCINSSTDLTMSAGVHTLNDEKGCSIFIGTARSSAHRGHPGLMSCSLPTSQSAGGAPARRARCRRVPKRDKAHQPRAPNPPQPSVFRQPRACPPWSQQAHTRQRRRYRRLHQGDYEVHSCRPMPNRRVDRASLSHDPLQSTRHSVPDFSHKLSRARFCVGIFPAPSNSR